MYFNKFNRIYYDFDINGETTVKSVRDITANVRLRKAVLENITLFDEYDIEDGETPNIIAAKVYGSSEYHWVVMLCNQRYDYLEDFPLDYHTLNQYVDATYGIQADDTHHYENDQGFVVMSNVEGAIPISNRQYEEQRNESKRRIKLISPSMLSTVLAQFQSLM